MQRTADKRAVGAGASPYQGDGDGHQTNETAEDNTRGGIPAQQSFIH